MIQHPNVYGIQCSLQSSGHSDIRLTRFSHAGRMIVGKNHRNRNEILASFHHFPRLHRSAIDHTPKKHPYIDNMMLIIQINAHKRLVRVASIAGLQILLRLC